MSIINKILNYLDSIPGKKNKKLIYLFQDLFLPLFLLIEYVCYRKIWFKIVIPELLTNDEIVNFLDRNEFGYSKNKLWKKDIIENGSMLDTFNPEEAEFNIQSEFVSAFTEIIEKNVSIDIENFITIKTHIDFVKSDRNIMKIYTVKLTYYRYPEIQRKLKYVWYWILSFCLIIFGIYYLLKLFPALI